MYALRGGRRRRWREGPRPCSCSYTSCIEWSIVVFMGGRSKERSREIVQETVRTMLSRSRGGSHDW